MSRNRVLLPCFGCGSFLFAGAILHSQMSIRLYKRTGCNALMCCKRSPKLAQHANSLRAVCRRIASTACVYTQAEKPSSLLQRKSEYFCLQREYPPDPLKCKNTVWLSEGCLCIFASKAVPKTALSKFKQQLYPERTRKWTNTEIKTVPENMEL